MDMSISREEFLRLLPGAVGACPLEEEDGVFSGRDGLQRWTVRIIPLADHRLGSVVLPSHRIEIQLEGYSDEAADGFLARFQRGYQRGGG